MDRGTWWAVSMGSQRIGYNWAWICTQMHIHTHIFKFRFWKYSFHRIHSQFLGLQIFTKLRVLSVLHQGQHPLYRLWESFLGIKSGGGKSRKCEPGRVVWDMVDIWEMSVYWKMLTGTWGDCIAVHWLLSCLWWWLLFSLVFVSVITNPWFRISIAIINSLVCL